MLWDNLDLNAYIFELSIVLSVIRILVFANSTSVEKLPAIKGMLVISTFGFGTLDWTIEPIHCVLWKYDYINLHLNDKST